MIRASHVRRIPRNGLSDRPLILGSHAFGLLDERRSRIALFDATLADLGEITFGAAGPADSVAWSRGPENRAGLWVHAHRQQDEAERSLPYVSFFELPDARMNDTPLVQIRSTPHANVGGTLLVLEDSLLLTGDRGLWGGGGGIACAAIVSLDKPQSPGAFDPRCRWRLEDQPREVGHELYHQHFTHAWFTGDGIAHAVSSFFEAWRFEPRTGARSARRALPGLERSGPWALEDPAIQIVVAARTGIWLAEVSYVARHGESRAWERGATFVYDDQDRLMRRAAYTRPVAIDPTGNRALVQLVHAPGWAIVSLPELEASAECFDEDAEVCGEMAADQDMGWAVGSERHADGTMTLRAFDLASSARFGCGSPPSPRT